MSSVYSCSVCVNLSQNFIFKNSIGLYNDMQLYNTFESDLEKYVSLEMNRIHLISF